MTSYFIALIDIHDPAGYQRYLDGFDTVFDRYNGEVVAVDESPMSLEDRWPAERTVLIRFPTEEDLPRWYRSPAYQRLASVRAAAASAIPVRALKLESYDYDGHDDRALGLTPLGRPPPRVLTTAATVDSHQADQRPTWWCAPGLPSASNGGTRRPGLGSSAARKSPSLTSWRSAAAHDASTAGSKPDFRAVRGPHPSSYPSFGLVSSDTIWQVRGCWDINRAWVADITYVSTVEGWLYLAVVMDLASRRIVGWSMSERIKADVVCQALQAAYWRRKPGPGLIMHSDRGSQYASDRHRKLIADFRMLQSMSRRANCSDNSPMESFFKTLKVESVYQLRYATRAEARLDLVDWIEGFYNHRRLHSSIGYQIPAHIESRLMAA